MDLHITGRRRREVVPVVGPSVDSPSTEVVDSWNLDSPRRLTTTKGVSPSVPRDQCQSGSHSPGGLRSSVRFSPTQEVKLWVRTQDSHKCRSHCRTFSLIYGPVVRWLIGPSSLCLILKSILLRSQVHSPNSIFLIILNVNIFTKYLLKK